MVVNADARTGVRSRAEPRVLNVALVGAGLMGAFHAETLTRRLPGVRLAGIADAAPGVAERLARGLGCGHWSLEYRALLADPGLDAVVVAAPARWHAEIVEAAAAAGKAVFCEKPLANDLAEADRAIRAAHAAGVPLQVGFQRRFDRGFRRAHDLVASGHLGEVQLLRATTRDPTLERAERVSLGAIFRETLIHDFDALRWLAGGAQAVDVFAMADALIRPDLRGCGLLDTAAVVIRFETGALATADASFQAVYGYDVRAEVFGSRGMATVGDGRSDSLVHYSSAGATSGRVRWFLDLFGEAYVAELVHFAECVRTGARPACTGEDGRAALAVALAALRSAQTGQPVKIADVETHACP